jgi:hypothetical protein
MPRSGRTRHDQPSTTPPQSLRGISQSCQRAFPVREVNGCAARWRAPLMLVQEPTSCSANVVERGFQQERIHVQVFAVRDCADRNGRRWEFGAVGRRRGRWWRSRCMLL